MPNDILVRPRTDADVVAIARIYGHHVTHGSASWELTPPDEAEMMRRATATQEAGYPYLVAEIDGKVVGYAYVGAYRPRPAYRFTVEHSIYIDTELRRGGVGSALMKRLIEVCTEQGFRQMIAVIGDSENLQSIRFHEKLGFIHAGIAKSIGFKFDRWLDQILMQLPLGEGDQSLPSGG